MPNRSAITEWSITSSAGASGLIRRGVAAELDDGLAHRGEVDDRGDAGEVLHDDPRGGELDLGVRLGVGPPAGERLDLGGVTFAPSSVRSRFSSRIFRLNGSRSAPSTAAREKMSKLFSPTVSRAAGSEAVLALCWHGMRLLGCWSEIS